MKYYIIAGEASGDLHASNLMRELKVRDASADFRFWGGDLMQAQGGALVKHYRDLAFMGFWEVLINIFTILANFKLCRSDMLMYKPDVVILIDYPGFNLRMAKFASKRGFKVFYYISPQVWAWKKSRVNLIKKTVDHMFVILPFEEEFYKELDYKVDFVGHPLLDAIEIGDHLSANGDKPTIAIAPGSRKQEISRMLPVMLSLKEDYPDHDFVVAGVSTIGKDIYESYLSEDSGISIEYDDFDGILRRAQAALVTSGTATLQTALFKVPLVVCYKGSYFSYLIAKQLIETPFISLVNLIMGREIVAELIQSDFNRAMLKSELDKLLVQENSDRIRKDFELLHERLGGRGASAKTAELMLEYLK